MDERNGVDRPGVERSGERREAWAWCHELGPGYPARATAAFGLAQSSFSTFWSALSPETVCDESGGDHSPDRAESPYPSRYPSSGFAARRRPTATELRAAHAGQSNVCGSETSSGLGQTDLGGGYHSTGLQLVCWRRLTRSFESPDRLASSGATPLSPRAPSPPSTSRQRSRWPQLGAGDPASQRSGPSAHMVLVEACVRRGSGPAEAHGEVQMIAGKAPVRQALRTKLCLVGGVEQGCRR